VWLDRPGIVIQAPHHLSPARAIPLTIDFGGSTRDISDDASVPPALLLALAGASVLAPALLASGATSVAITESMRVAMSWPDRLCSRSDSTAARPSWPCSCCIFGCRRVMRADRSLNGSAGPGSAESGGRELSRTL